MEILRVKSPVLHNDVHYLPNSILPLEVAQATQLIEAGVVVIEEVVVDQVTPQPEPEPAADLAKAAPQRAKAKTTTRRSKVKEE